MFKLASIAIVLALFSIPGVGQMRGGGGGRGFGGPRGGGIGFGPHGGRPSIGVNGPFHNRFHRNGFGQNGAFFTGWPYWPWYDDSYEPESYAPTIQIQGPEKSEPEAAPVQQAPIEPALYELRAGHWVRVNFGEAAAAQAPNAENTVPQPSAKELPPAVLVYRDGHTEELSSYSIIGTTLYAKGDYWSSGSWTRKIQMADLNIPATVKQNQARGVNFELPAGPNEVILRP